MQVNVFFACSISPSKQSTTTDIGCWLKAASLLKKIMESKLIFRRRRRRLRRHRSLAFDNATKIAFISRPSEAKNVHLNTRWMLSSLFRYVSYLCWSPLMTIWWERCDEEGTSKGGKRKQAIRWRQSLTDRLSWEEDGFCASSPDNGKSTRWCGEKEERKKSELVHQFFERTSQDD